MLRVCRLTRRLRHSTLELGCRCCVAALPTASNARMASVKHAFLSTSNSPVDEAPANATLGLLCLLELLVPAGWSQ